MKISVTRKVFLIIATLIVFMSGAFYVLAHNDLEKLFQSYASETRQRDAVQWADLVSYFYQADNHSWSRVNQDIARVMSQKGSHDQLPDQIVVRDNKRQIVVKAGIQQGIDHPNMDTQVPVIVNHQRIAELLIYGQGLEGLYDIEETVLHTMSLATMWGIMIFAILALFSGALMARRMTRPLKLILKAIQEITHGKLNTQIPIMSSDEFGQVAVAFNQMTSQLAATEEARKHLVADVAHELRIPLTIMQGQLELIQQGVKDPKPEDLLPIHDEVIRLSRLVQDLHQLSLAEVGKLHLIKEPTDMFKFLSRIVDNFEVEATDQQIQLVMNPNREGVVPVYMDRDRMTQVFVNLLGNALRYTPRGGTVTVNIERTEEHVVVSVSDTGPGIQPDFVPFVFDRFYRGEENRSRETGGTGLGLAIAKEFVEAHHGTVELQSTVGSGTTFIVRLPAIPL